MLWETLTKRDSLASNTRLTCAWSFDRRQRIECAKICTWESERRALIGTRWAEPAEDANSISFEIHVSKDTVENVCETFLQSRFRERSTSKRLRGLVEETAQKRVWTNLCGGSILRHVYFRNTVRDNENLGDEQVSGTGLKTVRWGTSFVLQTRATCLRWEKCTRKVCPRLSLSDVY